jgi:hypothetical protein
MLRRKMKMFVGGKSGSPKSPKVGKVRKDRKRLDPLISLRLFKTGVAVFSFHHYIASSNSSNSFNLTMSAGTSG